ncbi:MAG: tetratricopeptide repeat protein [Pseudomonadota bacterium]|nr:tetratricopeptide repeat protein [Pseudomonadota bacterium]MEC7380563.1 tetratricopeptide repeat protein [Pseudomonadota bacterium]MEC7412694.1 tetratricopeptide repeat protein [Pseudomonadota bacterium]MEC7419785.1 tetratricopeptide repeat protein [Pseudomonadota bacterium]MEC7555186.1 tetratricopeptide repeat protein [Pseudomonadota bacterium]
MTLTIYRIASIFLPLLLSACASTTTKPAPARGDTPITTANPAPSTPAPNRTASPTKTSATFALLSAADEALAGKQPEQAILLMERAVRIEPRNFELWIRLSRAHLASGNLAPAIQHARKAIALAEISSSESSRANQAKAWLQYAKVLDAQGNTREAASIRSRYRRQRG